MTQTPFDQLSKQYLEEFLAPMGTVQRQYEIPGEAKFVDVWFVPTDSLLDPTTVASTADLGLLGRVAQTMCLLEPFRNAPTRQAIRTAVLKLLWVQEDEIRKADQALLEAELPKLWILATTVSHPVIAALGGVTKPDWPPGVYFSAEIFQTAVVAIDQLPETEDTLWIRILGRDQTQERAIRRVLALPSDHPRRNPILRLLASWKVRIDMGEILDFSGEEAFMALSEAFLVWEQETQARSRQEGEQQIILRQLTRRVGTLPNAIIAQVNALALEQLEALGDALLDFTTLDDLLHWLQAA